MGKLLLRILLLIALVLLVNQVFYRLLIQPYANYSWGYDGIHAKRVFVKQHNRDINTLFLGSSAMFRHVNPTVFDEHLDSISGISSFNFGVPAMMPLQSEFIYRNLLEEDKVDLDYVFMDLMEVGNIFLILNAHRKRTHYWYDLSSYLEALRISGKYNSPAYVKVAAFMSYTIAYLAKMFNAEIVEEVLLSEKSIMKDDFKFLEQGRMGFYSLDMEHEDTRHESKAMQNRKAMFEKDTLQNTRLMMMSKRFFDNYDGDGTDANKLHIQKINDLISLSEQHNVHLIFVLHPRMQQYQYPILKPLYDSIPDGHKINLSNGGLYPEFYRAAYTFDPLHLNEEGANLFSKRLADEFERIVNHD